MNKYIYIFLSLLISLTFLLTSCSQDLERIAMQNQLGNLLENLEISDDTNNTTLSSNSRNDNSLLLYQQLYKEFKDRGFPETQSKARAYIGIETYEGEPAHIVFNGSHFYYIDGTGKRYEGQTYMNCSIYALVRLLKHLGQCGYIDADFWKIYSDEDFRVMIDNIGSRGQGYYLNQNQTVVPKTLRDLMLTLLPNTLHEYCEIYNPYGRRLNTDTDDI